METNETASWLPWKSTEGTAEVYLTFAANRLPLTYRTAFGGGARLGSAPSPAELQRFVQEHPSLQQVLEQTEALPRWIQRYFAGSRLVS